MIMPKWESYEDAKKRIEGKKADSLPPKKIRQRRGKNRKKEKTIVFCGGIQPLPPLPSKDKEVSSCTEQS
jgi:hypothetical protein